MVLFVEYRILNSSRQLLTNVKSKLTNQKCYLQHFYQYIHRKRFRKRFFLSETFPETSMSKSMSMLKDADNHHLSG